MSDLLSGACTPDSKALRQLDLKEWEPRQVVLSASELAEVMSCPANILKIQSTRGGLCRLQPGSIVGRLRLGTIDLRILPKTPIPSLLAILAETGDLTRLSSELVGYEASADICELLVRILLHQVDRVVRKGLKRTYLQEDEELVAARGRVDVRRSTGHHLRGRAVLQCQFEDYTLDGQENRILLAALNSIAACRTLPLIHRNLAHQIGADFVGVRPLGSYQTSSRPFVADRLNRHYLPALPLAELILQAMGLSNEFGIAAADGFLLDMNRLFETFVCGRLKTALTAEKVRVIEQRSFPFDEMCRAVIRPDLLAQSPQGRRVVVDTKYKVGSDPVPGDLYQMLAYCRVLNISHAVLVTVGSGLLNQFKVRDGHTTIEVISVDLGGTVTAIDNSVRLVADRVLDVLNVELRRSSTVVG